jgi:hypothetical protein
MSSVVIAGDTSGTITLAAPAVAGTTTLTLPATTGTVALTSQITGGLGTGQTYTNVNSSRANGTTYTNSTGKPIFVSLLNWGDLANQASNLIVTVNAVALTTQQGGGASSIRPTFFIVPDGQTYSVSWNASATSPTWWELR